MILHMVTYNERRFPRRTWNFFYLLLNISIITCIFGAHIKLAIVSLSFVFRQIMLKLVTINFLCITFYMIYNDAILSISHVFINFIGVSCNSSLSLSLSLSLHERFFLLFHCYLYFREKFQHYPFVLMFLLWYYYYH